MRVTQESDYAIRICCALDEAGEILDAEKIANKVAITKSNTLKVLRKLKSAGIVESHKGAVGGYCLLEDPEKLTICDLIVAIDGPIAISKCLIDAHPCSKNTFNKSSCKMHLTFTAINQALVERLSSVTVRSITDPQVSSLDIIEKIK